jgi:hypothetical protein
MMKSAVRQQRYRLKQEYFDPFPLHLVTKTSPLKCLTNEQSIQLFMEESKKVGMFPPKNQIVALYMLICHLTYIYFVFDVGDMSKEQRQPREC